MSYPFSTPHSLTQGLTMSLVAPLTGYSGEEADVGAGLQATWSHSGGGEDGFRIELSTDSFTTIAKTVYAPAGSTSVDIWGLLWNQEYDGRGYAYNEVGDSEVAVTLTPGTTKPDVPINLVAVRWTGSDVVLSWDAPVGPHAGAASYKVEYKLASEPTTWTVAAATEATTGYTVTGLTGETIYNFRVSGNSAGGTGAASAVVMVTTDVNPYVIEEDFEETGTPSSGIWTPTGAVDFDATEHTALDSQAMGISSTAVSALASLPDAPLDAVSVACMIECATAAAASDNRYPIRIRDAAATALVIMGVNTSGNVGARINGADTMSSTFVWQASTRYYVWLDFVKNGTCFFGISTSATKPSAGTDSATAFAFSAADALNLNASDLYFTSHRTGEVWLDRLFVSGSAIGDNPWNV